MTTDRNSILEEAAKIADGHASVTSGDETRIAIDIARRIRALKSDEAPVSDMDHATVSPAASDGAVNDPWMPIETAPHETAVLLYVPPSEILDGSIEIGPPSTGRRVTLSDGSVASNMSWHGRATHWMPLPEPPPPPEHKEGE
jgi:hypothetical protein